MSDYAGHLTTVANGSQWLTCRVQYLDDTDPFSSTNFPEPTRPPSYTFNVDLPLCEQLAGVHRLLKAPHKIDDCTLQISHTGAYLDLDVSINEQKEEFDAFFSDGKRNSIIIRTLLSVRVHSCIEKLYNSKGRELRRALFSLKQIFQDDKDLVHEFVNADGLTCLIKVGAEADQNYQNYILRALGQVMLYVDGMNGVIEHRETVQWLYTLIASRFRLVVKTTLKLLLVFVEYTETNASLLLDAVRRVDAQRRQKPWTNIMKVLDEKDGIDCELLVYAMTLVNKTLSNIPDQDTFYDITDALEEFGMEAISQRHLGKKGNDLDLVEQFKIYELALKHEDGDEEASNSSTPGVGIQWKRDRAKSGLTVERKSIRRHSANLSQQLEQSTPEKTQTPALDVPPANKSAPSTPSINSNNQSSAPELPQFSKRRRSRRDELLKQHLNQPKKEIIEPEKPKQSTPPSTPVSQSSDPTLSPKPWLVNNKKSMPNGQVAAVTQYNNAVAADTKDRERRRHRGQDRVQRKAEFLKNQNELRIARGEQQSPPNDEIQITDGDSTPPPPPVRKSSSKILEIGRRRKNLQKQQAEDHKNSIDQPPAVIVNGEATPNDPVIKMEGDILRVEDGGTNKKEVPAIHTKTQKLPLPASLNLSTAVQKPSLHDSPAKQSGPQTPSVISTNQKLMMEMIYANQSVAAKQESESDDGSEGSSGTPKENGHLSESEPASPTKPLPKQDVETEVTSVSSAKAAMEKMFANKPIHPPATIAPPQQNIERLVAPEPAPVLAPKKDSDLMWEKLLQESSKHSLKLPEFDFTDLTSIDDVDILSRLKPKTSAPSLPPGAVPPPPPIPGMAPPPPPPPPMMAPVPPPPPSCSPTPPPPHDSPQNSKRQRTIRLFWKEAKPPPSHSLQKAPSIWENIDDVKINEDKILHLFELRSKDIVKKQQTDNKKNKIVVLDAKRSNAINIGMTVLPPSRTIKSAILQMDGVTLNREQIEKLLAMIPSKEETDKIQDAMQENPDIPLGSAEQFLLTLSSISELSARLHLWSFKLDYEAQEKELAEQLIDLRDGMKQLRENKTFKRILAVLKSVGNFLNNTKVKGFDVRYLAKVPEVKDTVHKQSLLHHVTQLVIEHFPDSTDLYSEIGSVTRASKGDFSLLEETLELLETRCKEAWDHLKTIAKHETKSMHRNKVSDFLLGAAQRIITLGIVRKRLINRFHQTLVFFGMTAQDAIDTSPSMFCRLISEFALEYRTSKERVVTQQQKKQKRGERSKTRGKMITETRKFSQTEEQIKQKQMEMALGRNDDTRVETRRRQRTRSAKAKDQPPSPVINGHPEPANSSHPPPVKTSVRRRTSRKVVDDHSDETIMDELVKAATQNPHERTVNRRRRSRNSTRKSLRRTLRNGLTDEEKAVIMGKF